MDLIQLISLRLRELRHAHGITQEEAAELVGISLRFYQTLEAGRKKQMWLATVQKLADSFGLAPWQLIFPGVAEQSKLRFDVIKSSINYHRRRKGPQLRRQRETSPAEAGQCQAQQVPLVASSSS